MDGDVREQAPPDKQPKRPLWRRWHWYKVPLFLLSLFLFMLAITLMKDGAGSLGPFIRDNLKVTNFVNSMGFGWLFSYLIMSGSPVAGAAMAFLDAGTVDKFGAYGMVVGSRLGASFIVLFIGFLYVLRGRNRGTSLAMGLVSLAVAFSMQLMALGVGLLLLHGGVLDRYHLVSVGALVDLTDVLLKPLSQWLASHVPSWGLFVVGLGVMMASFNLFDRCLPEMTLKESGVSTISQMVYKPWVMFMLGSAVTLISMSVSISLGLLVPLSQRGFVRRENVIPYIMGANISTFIDTLLVALLFNNPSAFTVVLVEMVSLAFVAMLILLINYQGYERALLRFVDWALADNRHMTAFMVSILVIPVLLMLL